VIVATGIYTVLGGLRAVAYTEALQTVILVVGSILVMIYGLLALGKMRDGGLADGWGQLRETCGSEMFNLWKPLVPEEVDGTWAPIEERGWYSASLRDPAGFVDIDELWREEDQGIWALGGALKTDPDGDTVEQAIQFDKRKWESSDAQAWLRDQEYQWTDFGQDGPVIRQAWYFNDNYPWLGMLFCAPIIGMWYWCTDQYIVQRALGAPNEQQARRGSIFAAFLKLLPVFIFIIPGMICFALAKTGQVEAFAPMVDAGGEAVRDESQAAFPMMVLHVLPVGVRGLVVAGLLSALMSSLAGVFNASSTLFTMDLYQKFRPKATQHQLVWIGRVATAAMVLIGLAWIPVIQGAKGLYDYLQSVQGYLAPPIFVVFFFGVFMKRLNAKGCLAALVVGFLLGVARLAIDTPVALKDSPAFQWLLGGFDGYPKDSLFWIINHVYFQYYSLFVFLVSVVVMIVVSYLTKAPASEKIVGLTYATVTEEHRLASRKSWDARDVAASVLVLLAILAAYLYFTG
jgi:SSS family solute:Na+ symporter